MALGTVDVSKICGRGKTPAHLRPDNPQVSVVDRVALRKSFAQAGQASYWVDLLRHSNGTFQVYRCWRWYSQKEKKWVEGSTWSGHATRSQDVAVQVFVDMLATQAGKGYMVDQRTRSIDSPVPGVLLPKKNPPALELEPVTPSVEPPPEPESMRRKGDKDWW